MRTDIIGELERVVQGSLGNDLTEIGHGISRKVYRINTDRFGADYKGKVIKYAMDTIHIEENKLEFQTWMCVKGTGIENCFCPIRDRSENFEFLIMDYAKPVGGFRSSKHSDLKNEIRSSIMKRGGYDLHEGNIGVHQQYGKVLIDYPYGADFQVIE